MTLALLAPILVFGLVIFVHELGHFIAAKATGVYAPRFSIGFGPSIFKFRRGETEYVLAWLPLGGYVRMASRHDAEAAFLEGGSEEQTAKKETDKGYDPNAMIPFGPKPVPENRWFESKPLWARLVIMIAGIFMNVVLAVVVATVMAYHYGQYINPTTKIGAVHPDKRLPGLASLHDGDSVLAVNGGSVNTWNDIERKILLSTSSVSITTQRETVRIPLGQDSTNAEDLALALDPYLAPVVDTIFPGDRADQAGLQRGDSILSVGGVPVHSWMDMVDQIDPSANKPLTFVIRRRGAVDTLVATPKPVELTDSATHQTRTVGRLGLGAKNPVYKESPGVGQAIALGLKLTRENAFAVFRVLHDIGAGEQSVKQLGGPVAITKAAVSAARNGLDQLFYLIALLSINVAVLNLLPIPILDGGQILVNVLESVKGSPFSMRTREYILRAGLLAIGLLLVLVMYNDTHGDIARFFGWIGHLFGA